MGGTRLKTKIAESRFIDLFSCASLVLTWPPREVFELHLQIFHLVAQIVID